MSNQAALVELRSMFPQPKAPPKGRRVDHGWLAPGTAAKLGAVLNEDTRLVFEFGAWLGMSTKFILERAPNAVVVSVDLWKYTEEGFRIWASTKAPEVIPALDQGVLNTFWINLWDYRERLIAARMDSLKAMRWFKRLGLVPDVVYLDTSHVYEATFAELEHLTARFKDAQIVGDDWAWKPHRGLPVQAAVRTFCRLHPEWTWQSEGNGWALVKRT